MLKSLSCSNPPIGGAAGANMMMVRCDNLIVITSFTSKSIVYELVNNDLTEWSFGKSILDQDVKNKFKYGMFAMPMTLTLNHVPPVQQGY